jgi:geranylgeranyl diphosphate synthase, type II
MSEETRIKSIDPAQPKSLIASLREDVENSLRALELDGDLSILDDPIRYVLEGGGKRLRPILVLLAARLFRDDHEPVMPAALSVEVFHNFTLVHDDIMDHSDERRGRATLHVKWDDSTAILTGDYLLALAYRLLSDCEVGDLRAMLRTYHRMVRLLCEGQALDKWFETQTEVSVDDYFRMIYAKTGALVECSLELGGLAGGASVHELGVLRSVGRHVGRAFQLQDDLLDVIADDARWGKPVGGDLVEGKKTFILLRAIEVTTGGEHTWFKRILANNGLEAEYVPEARQRLESAGVLDEARTLVGHHSDVALEKIGRLPASPARDALADVVLEMRSRAH